MSLGVGVGVIQHSRDCPAFQFEERHLWLEAHALVTELCLDPESSIAAFVAIGSCFFFNLLVCLVCVCLSVCGMFMCVCLYVCPGVPSVIP